MGNSYQQIFYGAPGTGKSYKVKAETAQAEKAGNVFRTTFHPDSDYSTFVGAYKPTMNGGNIIYTFRPQVFTYAYVQAWTTTEPVYLIIEEINRGNCAQIFGDLFQLLDRNDDGFSEYPIEADIDLATYLKGKLGNCQREGMPEGMVEDVEEGKKLMLPNNLYIWATMNTSDQSLFPIDSAFKRRWDWYYVPIYNCQKRWKIKVNGTSYDWWEFLQAINDKIASTTNSEDKKLGYYFCKADKNGVIDAETFVGKVIFYLWNDVFKDFVDEAGNPFRLTDDTKKDPMLSFDKFYQVDENGKKKVVKVVEGNVKSFLENLGVGVNFNINGTQKNLPLNGLAAECVQEYVNKHPGMSAADVIQAWKGAGFDKPHYPSYFIMDQTFYNGWNGSNKGRVSKIQVGTDIIYVIRDGFNKNNIKSFINDVNVNVSNLGITIK